METPGEDHPADLHLPAKDVAPEAPLIEEHPSDSIVPGSVGPPQVDLGEVGALDDCELIALEPPPMVAGTAEEDSTNIALTGVDPSRGMAVENSEPAAAESAMGISKEAQVTSPIPTELDESQIIDLDSPMTVPELRYCDQLETVR